MSHVRFLELVHRFDIFYFCSSIEIEKCCHSSMQKDRKLLHQKRAISVFTPNVLTFVAVKLSRALSSVLCNASFEIG